MLVACWSVKGGCGTSVVAAMLALALGRWSAGAAVARTDAAAAASPLLVDLTALNQPINREPAVNVLKLLSGKDLETAEQWKAWLAQQPK